MKNNLVSGSGFRATGMYPYNLNEVFKRFPGALDKTYGLENDINESSISVFKNKRGMSEHKALSRNQKAWKKETGKQLLPEFLNLLLKIRNHCRNLWNSTNDKIRK